MKGKKLYSLLFPLILAIGITSFVSVNNERQGSNDTEGTLQLYFVDVGQGDCMLAKFPDRKIMLIDAGTNKSSRNVIQYLNRHGVKRIDILIATHPHEDHIGGMDEVVNKFDIGQIYMPKVSADTKTFESLLSEIKAKNLKINTAKGGTVLLDENGLKIEFLAPNGEQYEEVNNYSAVTKITYGSTSFLLTGDAEELSESEMMTLGYNLDADVLKIGHHGSSTSSGKEFIKKVSPQAGVISVGKDNSYNHPSQRTLSMFEELGIDIYRTDELGTIIVTSDGNNIKAGK